MANPIDRSGKNVPFSEMTAEGQSNAKAALAKIFGRELTFEDAVKNSKLWRQGNEEEYNRIKKKMSEYKVGSVLQNTSMEKKVLSADTATSREFDGLPGYPALVKGAFQFYAMMQNTSSVVNPLLAESMYHLNNKNHSRKLMCRILNESKSNLAVNGGDINQAWKFMEDNSELSLQKGVEIKSGDTLRERYQGGVTVQQLAEKGSDLINQAVNQSVDSEYYQNKDNPEVYLSFQLTGNNRKGVLEQRSLVLHVVNDTVYASFSALDNEAKQKAGGLQILDQADYPLFKISRNNGCELKDTLKKIIGVACLEFEPCDKASRVSPGARYEVKQIAVTPMVQYMVSATGNSSENATDSRRPSGSEDDSESSSELGRGHVLGSVAGSSQQNPAQKTEGDAQSNKLGSPANRASLKRANENKNAIDTLDETVKKVRKESPDNPFLGLFSKQ